MSSGLRKGVVTKRDINVSEQPAASVFKVEGLRNVGTYLPDYVACTSYKGGMRWRRWLRHCVTYNPDGRGFMSLEFFIILPAAQGSWGRLSL